MKQNSQNASGNFPLVTTKISPKPSAQLVLKDASGEAVQQWLISQNKCTLGSSENSVLQCQAPGIAPFHALLVVGSRQIFIRALAPKMTCDGAQVNEVLLHEERNHFELAGHRFEVIRLASSLPNDEVTGDETAVAANSNQRLKFTLARPLALQQRSKDQQSTAESKLMSLQSRNDNRWISGLIQSAVEPLECQLRNVLEPLAELQEETRRQRQLLEEQRQYEQSNATQRLAEALDSSSVGQLSDQLQQLAASQSAKIDLVKEKISDLNQQISTLEKIVAQPGEAQLNPQIEEAAERRAAEHSEAIHQVSSSLASVSSVLEGLCSQQSTETKSEQAWRQELDAQLAEINSSLNAMKTVQEENSEVLFNHVSEQTNSMLETTTAQLHSATESNHSLVGQFTQQNMQEFEELRDISTRTEESLQALASNDDELRALTTQWQDCLQTLVSQVEERQRPEDVTFGEATRAMTEELVRELETRTQQTQALVRQLASDTSQTDWQGHIEQRVSTLQELLERLVESLNLKELASQALESNASTAQTAEAESKPRLDAEYVWDAYQKTAEPPIPNGSSLTFGRHSSDLLHAQTAPLLSPARSDEFESAPVALTSEFQFLEMGHTSENGGTAETGGNAELDATELNPGMQPGTQELAEEKALGQAGDDQQRSAAIADDTTADYCPPRAIPSQPDNSPLNTGYDFSHLCDHPNTELSDTPPIDNAFSPQTGTDANEETNLFASSWGFEIPSESTGGSNTATTSNDVGQPQFAESEITEVVEREEQQAETESEIPAEAIEAQSQAKSPIISCDHHLEPHEPGPTEEATYNSQAKNESQHPPSADESPLEIECVISDANPDLPMETHGTTSDNHCAGETDSHSKLCDQLDSTSISANPDTSDREMLAGQGPSQPADDLIDAEASRIEGLETQAWHPEDPWQLTPREGSTASTSADVSEEAAESRLSVDEYPSTEGIDAQQESGFDANETVQPADEVISAASGNDEQTAEFVQADKTPESGEPDTQSVLPSWWTDQMANDVGLVDPNGLPGHDEYLSSTKTASGASTEFPVDHEQPPESAESNTAESAVAGLEHSPGEANQAWTDLSPSEQEDNLTAFGQAGAQDQVDFEQQFESESLHELDELVDVGPTLGTRPPFSQIEWGPAGEDSPSASLESDEFWAAVETGNSHASLPKTLRPVAENTSGQELNLLAEIGQHDVLTLPEDEQVASKITAQRGQADSQVASEVAGETLEEESVEAYMERLLDRVRRQDSGASPQLTERVSPVAESYSANPPSPTVEEAGDKQQPNISGQKSAEANSQSNKAQQQSDKANQGGQQSSSGEASAESVQGFAAMRELANSNARTAIHQSTRKRYATAAAMKCVLSIIAVGVGLTLLAVNGLNLGIGLFASLAAFMVAAIWGYDAIASFFPIVENSLVLKPTSPRKQEGKEEEPC